MNIRTMLKGLATLVLVAAFVLVWNLGLRSGTASAQSSGAKFSYLHFMVNDVTGGNQGRQDIVDLRNGNAWVCTYSGGCKFQGRIPFEQIVENPPK